MLNRSRILIKSGLTLAEPILGTNLIQQCRSVYILERRYPMPLSAQNQVPRKMKNKNFIYKQIANTDIEQKRPMLDLILIETVEGLGEKGDKIQVREHFGYNKLLLPKKAVYASPENIEKYKGYLKNEKKYSSLIAPLTMRYLSIARVGIGMSSKNPWTLEKRHIRIIFRARGIIVPEDAITLPEKPISGPNLENEGKEFYVTLTINSKETVKVRCVLYHHFPPNESPFPEDYWKYPGDALFPEDQQVLDSMPKKYEKMNEIRPAKIIPAVNERAY